MHHVAVLAFDGCYATSVTAVVDVFKVANQLWLAGQRDARPLFSWKVVSTDGEPVTTSSGLRLAVDGALPRGHSDVVFLPACHYTGDEPLLRRVDALAAAAGKWLRRQHAAGAWITAGCSGTFVLGRLGLLDGRSVTTSWWLAPLFRRLFPAAALRIDELVTVDGRLVCAGPVNAHFNLALRVVEEVAGRNLAMQCAKVMLVDANRQSQLPYVVMQAQTRHSDDLVARAEEWMQRHLREPFAIDDVAREVGASQRNLIRRFRRAHGIPPVAFLQELRIETARHLLETTDLSFDQVVERVGYRDPASFRKLFRARTALSPREYRRRFATNLSRA